MRQRLDMRYCQVSMQLFRIMDTRMCPVQADTIEEQRHRELQIPEFLKPQQKGIMERSMAARRV